MGFAIAPVANGKVIEPATFQALPKEQQERARRKGDIQPSRVKVWPILMIVGILTGAVGFLIDRGIEQRLAGGGELVDRVELPGQVVEADGAASPGPAGLADAEETEVVVVP